MKKIKSLDKEIGLIMNHYHFDPYNKQLYIKNCAGAIVKVVMEMVGEDDSEYQFGNTEWNPNMKIRNIAKQEIRARILGEGE